MFIIYSTSSNKEAATYLARKLNFGLQIAEITNFHCKEKLLSLSSGQIEPHAIIAHELWPQSNEKIIELLLLLDALESKGLKSATLIVPYIPYLRQDRELEKNTSTGSRMIAKLLKNTIIDKIISVDCHSERAISYFDHKFINIDPAPFFANILQTKISNLKKSIIISPDKGSASRAKNLSKILDIPYLVLHKKRENGVVKTSGFSTQDHYKTIIIIDDILDSGNTMRSTIEALKNSSDSIIICITHQLSNESMNSIEKLDQNIKIISTNSTDYGQKNPGENIWEIFCNPELY